MPKFCPGCGKPIPENVKYCPECGADIASFNPISEKNWKPDNVVLEDLTPPNPPPSLNHEDCEKKPKGVLIGNGSFYTNRKKIILFLIAIMGVSAIVGISLLISGVSSQPSDVVVQHYQYMKNGEYSQAIDLCIDPETNQPFLEERKEMIISSFGNYGSDAITRIQSLKVVIISTNKISDNKYLITGSLTYSNNDASGKNNDQHIDLSTYVVKTDGQWKLLGVP